jgi:2-keto-3-deoxy-L-rhamnonate aldolase RhmA
MKALDMGAEGVVVPHVNNSEDAIRALRAAWFPPDGNRGMCPDVRAARYDLNHWLNYAQTVRSEISIIPLIEEGDAVRNIDEIISVDGINAVFFGPADYTCSMSETVGKGFADDTMSEARVALEKVCKVAEKRNVSVMATPLTHLTDPAGANKKLIDMGVNAIVFATDTMVFHEMCQKIADAFRNRVR